jgi:hypothetical protein
VGADDRRLARGLGVLLVAGGGGVEQRLGGFGRSLRLVEVEPRLRLTRALFEGERRGRPRAEEHGRPIPKRGDVGLLVHPGRLGKHARREVERLLCTRLGRTVDAVEEGGRQQHGHVRPPQAHRVRGEERAP